MAQTGLPEEQTQGERERQREGALVRAVTALLSIYLGPARFMHIRHGKLPETETETEISYRFLCLKIYTEMQLKIGETREREVERATCELELIMAEWATDCHDTYGINLNEFQDRRKLMPLRLRRLRWDLMCRKTECLEKKRAKQEERETEYVGRRKSKAREGDIEWKSVRSDRQTHTSNRATDRQAGG